MTSSTGRPALPALRAGVLGRAARAARPAALRIGAAVAGGILALTAFPPAAAAAPSTGAGSLQSVTVPAAPDPPPGPPATGTTTVSLTFDDGNADQMTAVDALARYDLRGTFFIVSGYVGHDGYLTRDQLHGIAAAGHEIGGHTATHPDLTALAEDEAARQMCDSRAALLGWGFQVRNLAYPYAASDDRVEALAAGCGYNSARGLGGVHPPQGECPGCRAAESIPPANPFRTAAPAQVDSSWTLADLQRTVTRAEESGGGWVQLTFHHLCSQSEPSCAPSTSISPEVFDRFARWLTTRPATTEVRTVADVIGGAVQPAVSGPRVPPPAAGVNAVINEGLEQMAPNGVPECWTIGAYGDNTATFTTVSPGRTGDVAGQLTVTDYSSGDAKLMTVQDMGQCSTTVEPGERYRLGAWYKSTAITQFAAYLRDAAGKWHYWSSSGWFYPQVVYTHAQWATEPVPEWATAMSFGMNLFDNGVLTTDDYSLMLAGPEG